MIPLELISGGAGMLGGFIFRLISTAQANKQALFERLIKANQEADNSANQAVARDNASSRAGQITRRVITMCILFGVIIAPFIFPLLNLSTIVQIDTPVNEWLGGLIKTGGKANFYEINGYLVSPNLTSYAALVISFYFGQASGKAN